MRPFAEWVAGQDIGFAGPLERWDRAFPGCLTVYNYDAMGDVAEHFLSLVGVEGLTTVTANRQPPPEMLAAWSVFNSRRKGRAMPGDFQAVARQLGLLDEGRQVGLPLEKLLPGREDLEALQQHYASDLAAVNRYLERSGQAPLRFGPVKETPAAVDPWSLTHLLFEMVFALNTKVETLSHEVEALRNQASESG